MMLSLVAFAISLLPIGLDTFDLECVSRPSDSPRAKAESVRYSINLADKSWCNTTSCANKVSTIALVDDTKIYLVNMGTSSSMARIAVNRVTGQYAFISAMTAPYVFSSEKVGQCELRQFTPHGPPPWLG